MSKPISIFTGTRTDTRSVNLGLSRYQMTKNLSGAHLLRETIPPFVPPIVYSLIHLLYCGDGWVSGWVGQWVGGRCIVHMRVRVPLCACACFTLAPHRLYPFSRHFTWHEQSGRKLGAVELPPWANGSPAEFIRIHRQVQFHFTLPLIHNKAAALRSKAAQRCRYI